MIRPAAVLSLQAVRHSYRRGGRRVPVLDDVDLTVGQGERVAVLGSSGGGKSTLLQVASGVLRPDEGQVVLLGHDLMTLRPHRRASLRLAAVGHVHQDFRLLPMLSARDNVAVVARLQGVPATQARARAEEALREVGLAHRAEHLPGELSGGEQQRVAIARAVLSPPRLLLADEPTGALDAGLREEMLEIMLRAAPDAALLLVTHDEAVAARTDRVVELAGGRLESRDLSSSG